jgi:hypothetical protein
VSTTFAVPDADCRLLAAAELLVLDEDEDVDVAADGELDELLPQAPRTAVPARAAIAAHVVVNQLQGGLRK